MAARDETVTGVVMIGDKAITSTGMAVIGRPERVEEAVAAKERTGFLGRRREATAG